MDDLVEVEVHESALEVGTSARWSFSGEIVGEGVVVLGASGIGFAGWRGGGG